MRGPPRREFGGGRYGGSYGRPPLDDQPDYEGPPRCGGKRQGCTGLVLCLWLQHGIGHRKSCQWQEAQRTTNVPQAHSSTSSSPLHPQLDGHCARLQAAWLPCCTTAARRPGSCLPRAQTLLSRRSYAPLCRPLPCRPQARQVWSRPRAKPGRPRQLWRNPWPAAQRAPRSLAVPAPAPGAAAQPAGTARWRAGSGGGAAGAQGEACPPHRTPAPLLLGRGRLVLSPVGSVLDFLLHASRFQRKRSAWLARFSTCAPHMPPRPDAGAVAGGGGQRPGRTCGAACASSAQPSRRAPRVACSSPSSSCGGAAGAAFLASTPGAVRRCSRPA